jgi:hypothetical protein
VGDATGDRGKVSNHKEGFSHIVNPKWPRGGFKGRHASVNPNHSAECCAAVAAALDFFQAKGIKAQGNKVGHWHQR